MNLCDSCKYCVGLGRDAKGNIVSRRCQCPDKQFQAPIEQKCRCYIPLRPDSSAVGNGASPVTPPVRQNTMPQGTEPSGRPVNPENGSPEVMRSEAPQNTAPVQEENPPKKKKAGKIVAIILVILLALSLVGAAVLGVGGFLVYKYVIKGESLDVEFVDGEGNVVNPFESTDDDFFVYEYDHSKNEGKTGIFFDVNWTFGENARIEPDVGLNLRLAPNTDSLRIRIMEFNEEVYVYAISNGWALVNHNGDIGWCSAEFLIMDNGEPETPWCTLSDTVYAKNDITEVRACKGDNAPVVMFIPAGTSVTRLAVDGEWTYVEVNGFRGWCMTEALSESNVADASELLIEDAVVSCYSYADVYESAKSSSDILFTLNDGDTVYVLMKKGEYVLVDRQGQRGWIHRDYLNYEADKVRPVYSEQYYNDEIAKAQDESRQIADAFVGKKVKGWTEMSAEDVVDFHIKATIIYFGINSHSPSHFFDETVHIVDERYYMVKDADYENIADFYSMIYSYFSDELAQYLTSLVFEYNGAIYATSLDIGGCTYPYDEYNYVVRHIDNGFEIDIDYTDEWNDLHDTCHVELEDGIYVVTDLSPILPP